MGMDWENRGRYGGYGSERRRTRGESERDWTDRAGDELRSWFGDEDAERRRRLDDERHERMGDYGREYQGGHGEEYGGRRWADAKRSYSGDNQRPYGGYEGDHERRLHGRYGGEEQFGYQGRGSYSGDYQGGREYRRRAASYGSYSGGQDRSFMDRAGDEIASWFGDEDAERRRRMEGRHRGQGPRNYTRSDERIREDVNDRLSDDPHIDASNIDVTVESGEVTLDGTVDERFAKRHAEDIAESVSGVRHVQNNLRVSDQRAGNSAGTMTGGIAGA